MDLIFSLRYQLITREDKNIVAAGSRGYLYARFLPLTPDWTGIITAVFNDQVVEMTPDGSGEYRCKVPDSCIVEKGVVKVAAYCGSIHTTTVAQFTVQETADAKPDQIADPYEPLRDMVGNCIQTSTEALERVQALDQAKVDKVDGKGLSANDFTDADKAKLDGVEAGANKYTHPSYTPKSSGLYKVTVDSTGHVSGTAAVTKGDITSLGIPGQDTTYTAATTAKAGLMSAADKSKLDGVEAGANRYTHPSYTPKAGGLYKVEVDSTGHVSGTAAVTKGDINRLEGVLNADAVIIKGKDGKQCAASLQSVNGKPVMVCDEGNAEAMEAGFLSDEAFADALDTQNALLAGLLYAQGGSIKPTSFKQVQEIVRAGLADKVFHIGDQLTCQKGNETLVWDVIGIDHDKPADPQFKHSLTLQLHDCYTSFQFDDPEALYYCEEELPAGTYNFTLLADHDTAYGGGKTYQFTLANAVPAGGQICFPWNYNTQAAATKVSTYANRTTSAVIETVAVTEGSGGTSLGTADGNSTNMNHTHRIRLGSNNWAESAMRKLLNSDKEAGSVLAPQTKFDRPPLWAADKAGFLNGMDSEFLEVVGETEKVTALSTGADGGGSDITTDKFFLLSRSEVYAGKENGVDEEKPYPYYSDYSDLPAAGTDPDSNRVKYRNGSAQYWWLRTPVTDTSSHVRIFSTDGQLNVSRPNYINGIAPACNII